LGLREKRRKLHNEELYDLYFSPNIIRVIKSRRMRWAGHVEVNAGIWFKEDGKRTLRRTKRWWEYNIKMDVQEVVLGHRLD
jgi:hypothetical protein